MVKGFGPPVVRPQEVRESKILRQSVIQHFQAIEDPRVDRTKQHSLMAIITIAILAVLAGADSFVAIAHRWQSQAGMVGEVFRLTQWNPITRYAMLRVLAALEPGELQASFLSWVSSISEKLSPIVDSY